MRLANITAYDVVGKQIAKELGEERVRSIALTYASWKATRKQGDLAREYHIFDFVGRKL